MRHVDSLSSEAQLGKLKLQPRLEARPMKPRGSPGISKLVTELNPCIFTAPSVLQAAPIDLITILQRFLSILAVPRAIPAPFGNDFVSKILHHEAAKKLLST